MIYRLETIDRTISAIVRRLKIGNDEIPYQDFVEYIADAMEHIGSYYQFEEKEVSIIIEDFKGVLPCDHHKTIRMKRGCEINPSSEGGFYGGTLVNHLLKLGVDFDSIPAYERYHILPVAGISKIDNNIIDEVGRLNHNENLINPTMNKFTGGDYNENLGRITTAFRYGIIQIQYLAIPIDERGFPMIPDNVSFRDALFWRCVYMLGMGDPEKLKNPQMRDIRYSEQQWNFYCAQARANANSPDLAMMERIKNNHHRLLNTIDDEVNDYRSLGKRQGLNFEGNH